MFDSLKSQTYTNFEHIIVDDGSNDGIDGLVCAYANSVRFTVKYIIKANGGKHSAMNLAFDYTEGEFIIRLDSDDRYTKDCLKLLIDEWDKIPSNIKDEYWCVAEKLDMTQNK